MRSYGTPTTPSLRLLGALALACLLLGSFALAGCGGSDSSDETAGDSQAATQEQQENQQAQKELDELKGKELTKCKTSIGQLYANERAGCEFAENVKNAYYTEVVSGSGKTLGIHPRTGTDFMLHCSGTVPHKCTGYKDDGKSGIPPLKGGLIFFTP
jgi:hypothetical protein